ncbi:MAG: acetylxylan esterase [Pirellulales bacterium]|nr:acetylxylan esterase [Pirellulales bacterium]
MIRRKQLVWFVILGLAVGCRSAKAETSQADPLRILPAGQVPDDNRLEKLRTLDDYFPFHAVDSLASWQQRADRIRRRIRVATGLWPWPTRVPLKPVVTGCVERDGYTVEKVYIQSWPGHYVTGNLYRPHGTSGKHPAILTPHGHWPDGRFVDLGADEVRNQIAEGAERFEVGGRYPLQARCVQLVRMGCIVFHYDMVGYADSNQLDHHLGVRDAMNRADSWGFMSPQAELHLQNLMGLQTWNSIRALDYLLSLEDVDPERIGVTGASGGGTQTFMLCALDPRPAVAFPAVMVSTAMQGGCVCENAPYLRIDNGNIDIAALIAPRPLGLTAANDWTVEIQTKGLPDLQKVYAMLGAEGLVSVKACTHFPHNYNSVSRTAMYHWFNRHLKLGHNEPILEKDYVPLTRKELSVWGDGVARPDGYEAGDAHERALVSWQTEDANHQISQLIPQNATPESIAAFRQTVGGAFDTILGRRLVDIGPVTTRMVRTVDMGGFKVELGLADNTNAGEQIPVAILSPPQSCGKVTLWVHPFGKRGLFHQVGGEMVPLPEVRHLLEQGHLVIGMDLLYQGEFLKDDQGPELRNSPMVRNQDWKQPWHRFSGYTFGYNHPLFAQRVHDILAVIQLAQGQLGANQIQLAGFGPVAGPLVIAARCQAGAAVTKAAVTTGGFRFSHLDRFDHPAFLPGAVKYLDLPGLIALNAPYPVWIAEETETTLKVARQVYESNGQKAALVIGLPSEQPVQAALDWLLE